MGDGRLSGEIGRVFLGVCGFFGFYAAFLAVFGVFFGVLHAFLLLQTVFC